MASQKSILFIVGITGSYVIFYIIGLLISIVLNGELPFEPHTHAEMFGIAFFVSFGILIGGVYVTMINPEIREKIHGTPLPSKPSPLEVLLYISTDDEISVIKSIEKLSPRAYKFEIARETELSRMKIHRILLRLAERGIVNIEKNGRYSVINLAEWIK